MKVARLAKAAPVRMVRLRPGSVGAVLGARKEAAMRRRIARARKRKALRARVNRMINKSGGTDRMYGWD